MESGKEIKVKTPAETMQIKEKHPGLVKFLDKKPVPLPTKSNRRSPLSC